MPTINRITKKPHKRNTWKMTEARKRRVSIYATKEWRKLRLAYLYHHPTCELCEARGIVTLATQVHHADSFQNYDDLMARFRAYDYTNLVALCDECHGWLHRHGTTTGINLEFSAKQLDEIYGKQIRIKDGRALQQLFAAGEGVHGVCAGPVGGKREDEGK